MFYSLLVLQILTLCYHQITTRFDFFPFNGIRHYSIKERRKEALINGIIMVVPIIFVFTRLPVLIGFGGFIWTLILLGAIFNWWLPYTTGRVFINMSGDDTWEEVYERNFSKTITILPRIKNNPTPNLEHMILHTLILGSSILSWIYTFTN